MLKRRTVPIFGLVLLVSMSSVICGCGANLINKDEEYVEMLTQHEKEKIEMTEEQMELLCSISANEEKVREGELADWQIEVLKQYDYATSYLEKKYPSYSFIIPLCEPMGTMNSYVTFYFFETRDTDRENRYELRLEVPEEKDSDKPYMIRDNFYGGLYEDVLARKIYDLITQEIPECVRVTCNITALEGEELGENLDLEDILCGELTIEHDTDFYIDASGMDEKNYSEKVNIIKEYINSRNIIGSYDVKFVSQEDDTVLYREHFFCE